MGFFSNVSAFLSSGTLFLSFYLKGEGELKEQVVLDLGLKKDIEIRPEVLPIESL